MDHLNRKETAAELGKEHVGFWLVSTLIGACDQTIEDFHEHARFYAGPIPSALRAALLSSSKSRNDPAANAELTTLASNPAARLLIQARPDCPFAQTFHSRVDKEGAAGMGWSLHLSRSLSAPDIPAIEISWSDDMLLIADAETGDFQRQGSVYGLAGGEFDDAMACAARACLAILEGLGRALGLPPPISDLIQGKDAASWNGAFKGARPRWGDDTELMCMSDSNLAAARSLAEHRHIDQATPKAPAPGPKPRL